MLQSFPPADLTDMIEPDGQIHVTCEYCSRNYVIAPEALSAEGRG
jgi:molecular chaperone Hsp33